jgi:hypothetical protein
VLVWGAYYLSLLAGERRDTLIAIEEAISSDGPDASVSSPLMCPLHPDVF